MEPGRGFVPLPSLGLTAGSLVEEEADPDPTPAVAHFRSTMASMGYAVTLRLDSATSPTSPDEGGRRPFSPLLTTPTTEATAARRAQGGGPGASAGWPWPLAPGRGGGAVGHATAGADTAASLSSPVSASTPQALRGVTGLPPLHMSLLHSPPPAVSPGALSPLPPLAAHGVSGAAAAAAAAAAATAAASGSRTCPRHPLLDLPAGGRRPPASPTAKRPTGSLLRAGLDWRSAAPPPPTAATPVAGGVPTDRVVLAPLRTPGGGGTPRPAPLPPPPILPPPPPSRSFWDTVIASPVAVAPPPTAAAAAAAAGGGLASGQSLPLLPLRAAGGGGAYPRPGALSPLLPGGRPLSAPPLTGRPSPLCASPAVGVAAAAAATAAAASTAAAAAAAEDAGSYRPPPTADGDAGAPGGAPPGTPAAARPYTCDECGSTHSRAGNLAKHVRLVHGRRRPHVCDECGAAFGQRSNLSAHARAVHRRLRPHACGECPAAFAQKSALVAHVSAVHRRLRPYACTECGCVLGARGGLRGADVAGGGGGTVVLWSVIWRMGLCQALVFWCMEQLVSCTDSSHFSTDGRSVGRTLVVHVLWLCRWVVRERSVTFGQASDRNRHVRVRWSSSLFVFFSTGDVAAPSPLSCLP